MDTQLINNYKTKDLYEAAFIYANNVRLLRLERERDFYWFIFDDEQKCQNLADSFWAGGILVEAKAFANALRTLKDRLFARR